MMAFGADGGVFFVLGMLATFLLGGAGLALFIVGLVKGKPSMWGGGIVLGVGAFVGAVTMVALMAFFGVRAGRRAAMRTLTAQLATIATGLAMYASESMDFETATGIALPQGAETVYSADFFAQHGRSMTDPQGNPRDCRYEKIRVPSAFADTLKAQCRPATWDEVKHYLAPQLVASWPEWNPPPPERLTCYTIHIRLDAPVVSTLLRNAPVPSGDQANELSEKEKEVLALLDDFPTIDWSGFGGPTQTYIAYDDAEGIIYAVTVVADSTLRRVRFRGTFTCPTSSDPTSQPAAPLRWELE